ncbi:MAG TPA: VOC family protein [Patescibacteria group bacterium]|nr:VOC family protein [Patescibacteria group bacterium]
MQKIIPHLWFDKEAKEAAEFYTSLFPNSKINNITTLRNTPSGDTDVVSFQLWNYSFLSISAGPYFKFNPSISMMVNFDPSQDPEAKQRIDEIWGKLSEGGKVLMPLDKYPFSEHYGWVQDKYGFSWQLILTNPEGEERPIMIPFFLFTKEVYGKVEEASDFYLSVFSGRGGDNKRGAIVRYGEGQEPDKADAVMFTDFKLASQWFAAMESAREHEFTFNEAVSLIVNCEDQAEIDYFWEKLSAVPEAEQCGWLKDKYGVSWQVVPKEMGEMLAQGTPEQVDKVTKAFLPMKKFDIAKLKEAYNS